MKTAQAFDIEIEHKVLVRAEPERVYDAFATAQGLDSWFTSGSEVDARPGGRMIWRWKDWGPDNVTDTDEGPVLEAQRPERFVFQWDAASGHPTTIDVTFERAPDGTLMTLRHSGHQDTPKGRRALVGCASGWGEALTLLKFYVEHGLRY